MDATANLLHGLCHYCSSGQYDGRRTPQHSAAITHGSGLLAPDTRSEHHHILYRCGPWHVGTNYLFPRPDGESLGQVGTRRRGHEQVTAIWGCVARRRGEHGDQYHALFGESEHDDAIVEYDEPNDTNVPNRVEAVCSRRAGGCIDVADHPHVTKVWASWTKRIRHPYHSQTAHDNDIQEHRTRSDNDQETSLHSSPHVPRHPDIGPIYTRNYPVPFVRTHKELGYEHRKDRDSSGSLLRCDGSPATAGDKGERLFANVREKRGVGDYQVLVVPCHAMTGIFPELRGGRLVPDKSEP